MTHSNERSFRETSVPARSAAVHAVEVDGEAVLLDEVANRLHHLNGTATLVWSCLDGISTIDEIAKDVSDELDLPHAQVLADILELTCELGEQGLLAVNEMARWRRRPDALWRRSLDGVVVLPADGDAPVSLEGTGPALWDLLAEANDVEALARKLAGEHGTDPAVVAADIEPVLEDLEAAGALERVPN